MGSRQERNWPGRNAMPPGTSRKSERRSPPWSWTAARTAVRSSAMAAGDLVDRVARHEDLDDGVVVVDHRLASEARRGRQARRLVEQILLVLLGLREAVEALLHHDVARGARAAPAARVLERDAVGEEHVEDRAGPAVVLEGGTAQIDLDHALGVAILESHDHFRHRPSGSSRGL